MLIVVVNVGDSGRSESVCTATERQSHQVHETLDPPIFSLTYDPWEACLGNQSKKDGRLASSDDLSYNPTLQREYALCRSWLFTEE